jgi:Tfp pilus assembly protein PilF
MKRWSWLLVAALIASPAIADDKKKDEKKGKDAPAAAAPQQDALAAADAKLAAGDADGALSLLEKAMATDGRAGLKAGALRESRGELEQAIDAYKAAADKLSGAGKGEALGRMAVVQDTRGMADEPNAVGSVTGLAGVLRQTKRAAEAEPMLKKVIDASPGAVEAYKEMTRVKIALGRAQDALGDANLAAAMADNDPEAKGLVIEVKVARALQALAEGQTDLALQDLTQLRDQSPESAIVRVGLGRVQIARRDTAAALAELQKAVELDAKNAEAQYSLGYVQHVMKQSAAAAVGPFEKAVALEPGNLQYRTSLGAALNDADQLDRAVAELSKVAGAEGYKGWDAPFYLGAAQLKAKRYKEATAAFEQSLAAKPGNAQAEGYLAWAYFGLKDASNFKAHGAKARSLGFKDPQLLDRLAKVEAWQPIK